MVTGHFSQQLPGVAHCAHGLSPRVVLGGERLPNTAVPAVGTTTGRHPQTDWRLRLKAQLFRSIVNGRVTSEGGGDAHLLRDGAMLPAGCGWCVQRWQR